MMDSNKLFQTEDRERIWRKYCGFLDLSLDEFMDIQEQLLMEQIELVYNSPITKDLMPKKPKDISEFRQLVPLTTYDDYAGYLNEKMKMSWLSSRTVGLAPQAGEGALNGYLVQRELLIDSVCTELPQLS